MRALPALVEPFPKDVLIGRRSLIDDSVKLGARSGRVIPLLTLRIGEDAIVRSGSVIYGGSVIGDGLETGHNVVIREQNAIGSGFKVWNNAKIRANIYVPI